MSSASLSSKICFNPDCAELKTFPPRTGWLLRTGSFAELCDRCASAYEKKEFCETYHLTASGWRSCESCGKRVHCGCIASAFDFKLLDAGGIECKSCSRKKIGLEQNLPRLSSQSYMHRDSLNLNPFNEAGISTSRDMTSAPLLGKRQHDDFPDKLSNTSTKVHTEDASGIAKAGYKFEQHRGSCLNSYQLCNCLKDNPSTPQCAFTFPCTASNNKPGKFGFYHACQTPISLQTKDFGYDLNDGADSPCKNQLRNVRLCVDSQAKHFPGFTQDLQNKSIKSESIITPLFEKMLSASDTGRIGRLVLPKKCAEAYLPPISLPEGLPLKIQDTTGKEWMFQYRFWPNNNSRMYVLEGVTPCIQKMQLQAGDIVTFSRLDPEGKLIMGFRKAKVASNQAELADSIPLTLDAKSVCVAKEAPGAKSASKKRKNSKPGLGSRRLRLENEDPIELTITWEEAQGCIQPPINHSPTIVVIEGVEFEEYEEAPIFGKQIEFAKANLGSRSSCSADNDLGTEDVKKLQLPGSSVPDKLMAAEEETEDMERTEAPILTKLATLEDGEGVSLTSQTTTKHPRHKFGCSCIVCIQSPSGRGPKHEPDCTCTVCQSVKSRSRTLMLRREKKQLVKEEETGVKKQPQSSDEVITHQGNDNSAMGNSSLGKKSDDDDNGWLRSPFSGYKGRIDLNIQPERDEESSPERTLAPRLEDC